MPYPMAACRFDSVPVAAGGAPDAPSGLESVDFPALNPTNLQWVDNSDDETSFRLERQFDPPAGSWDLVEAAIAANAVTYTEAAPLSGGNYKWRIRAEGPGGNSDWVESPEYLIPA